MATSMDNAIKPFNRRPKSKPTAAPSPDLPTKKNAAPEPDDKRAQVVADVSSLPEEIRQRFIRRGRKYHLPDGTHVFTDRGKRLTTPSENTEVIATLIQIAKTRGWKQITVTGTERFRREVWGAAQLADLQVRGYKPSEQEQALIVRRIARERGEKGNASGKHSTDKQARQSDNSLWVGKLMDHGPAPYKDDPKQSMSYFVRIETSAGESTLWGVDFERAVKESASRPQIGDDVTLRSLGQKPVTISVPTHDADGRVLGEKKMKVHRNSWLVEQTAFLNERSAVANVVRDPDVPAARAVKSHPSLVGTYMTLHAAEIAAKTFRHPREQARFVELVRNGLADSIERGEPLPTVRLREPPPRTPERELRPARTL